ncbi:MAG: hypothetical protein HYX63_24015 [Gammaproteobacteria bacterium]|nr:hypothetical protein [Gammaproteobacteria bacterium]
MTLPSGLSDSVADSEPLARFLTSSSQFNVSGVKPSVFLPNPKNNQTSVFRHGAEPREALWRIAREYAVGDRPLHGAAVCLAGDVRAVLLEVNPKEPPPGHANIENWSVNKNDPELTKATQKELATKIAQRATLVQF